MMNINDRINQLLDYGLHHQLFKQDDVRYIVNRIQQVLPLNHFERMALPEAVIEDILSALVKDNLELKTRLIDCLLPRPSELYQIYRALYRKSPKQATTFFYDFSKTALNIHPKWQEYIQSESMSIGDINYQVLIQNDAYDWHLSPKENQRSMSISFNNEKKAWALQYLFTPLLKEQAKIYRKETKDVNDSESRYNEMLNFLNKYPHYLIYPNINQEALCFDGTYCVANDHLPVEDAPMIKKDKSNRVKVELLEWFLPVVRLISNNENRLLDIMYYLERAWVNLNHETHMVFPIMCLDGIQFNVYLYMIKNDDLEHLNGLSAMGYVKIKSNQSISDAKDYLQSLMDHNIFANDHDEFISFVEKAI